MLTRRAPNEAVGHAVKSACDRYGITLLVDERLSNLMMGYGWMIAPSANAALSHKMRSVMATSWDYFPAIHEIEHLVWWHHECGVMVPENLMMPVGIAILKAVGLPSRVYLSHPYTSDTKIAIDGRRREDVADWLHPKRSMWYRRAVAANIAAGVLTESMRPTWRLPDWSKVDIQEHVF